MKVKKFHLKDFPAERVRIRLKNNQKFLDESIDYFSSIDKLANFLSVSPQVIYNWKKLNLYIPLQHIKKIVNERKLDWNNIEKNVVAYKGPNLSLQIRNPKLPIVESPELFAIISHLIGDGSININNIPSYFNTNKKLIGNFQKLIKFVFGDIEGKIYKKSSGAYEFRTSRIISDLIKSFYKINFGSRNARIPKKVISLPKEFSIALIRAFADDESMVDSNHRITFFSINKPVLKIIRSLLIKKLEFRNVTPILKGSNSSFYLTIKAKDIQKYYTAIGFNHPLKMIKLSKIIEIRKSSLGVRRKENQTKDEIIHLLSCQSLSTEELTSILKIRKNNVNIPLKELKKEGLIDQLIKNGHTIKWTKMEG